MLGLPSPYPEGDRATGRPGTARQRANVGVPLAGMERNGTGPVAVLGNYCSRVFDRAAVASLLWHGLPVYHPLYATNPACDRVLQGQGHGSTSKAEACDRSIKFSL